MKQSFIFTLFLLLSSVFSFGQRTVFPNGVDVINRLESDTILVSTGIKTKNLRVVDTLLVEGGVKISKNLNVDSIAVTRGVNINNTLTANTITAQNYNFPNSLNLAGGNLTLGNHSGNSDFILRYRNFPTVGATFAFYKGNPDQTGIIRDATITKITGQPLTFSTDAAENIEFNTANTKRMTIGGTGNVGIGAEPTASEKLTIDGKLKVTGNANIGSSPTADSLTINGKLRVIGNIGIGADAAGADRLNIAGNVKISGSEPTFKAEGSYPTLDLDGGTNTYPRIHFSGANVGGLYEKNFTTLTGEGGGFRIKTSGALSSELLGTTALTATKQLHVYLAQNWAGWAEVASKGLYGGAAYANAIDFVSGTRLKIDQNQYTGGLLMGYSNSVYPLRSNYVAGAIKSQYMGTEINTAGQHKFDMVFGINSDGAGTFSFDPTERMRIKDNGIVNVGKAITINTNLLPSTGNYRLAVGGDIICEKIVITTLPNWPDYVFDKGYKLTPLSKVEQFIQKNGHLPNVPSAAEVKKDGIEVGTMNAKLLEKIEELTLYIINQQKQIDELKEMVKNIKKP